MENKENTQKAKDTQAEENSLAMDLLQDYKLQFKRLFRLLVIVLALWAATIAGFLLYLNQYDFISYTQDGTGYNNINTHIEGSVENNNGAEIKSPNEKSETTANKK